MLPAFMLPGSLPKNASQPMNKPVPCRIDGIVAHSANSAVVFRRGPSHRCQLLTWNFDSDEILPGQWLNGRVYTPRCDVSPDGRYLVIGATNYSRSRNISHPSVKPGDEYLTSGWTAISRPPYFSALALWFTGGAWNGGGIWDGPKSLRINDAPCLFHEAVSPGKAIKVRSLRLGASEDEPIFSMRLALRGWKEERKQVTTLLNPDWRRESKRFLKVLLNPKALDAMLEMLPDALDKMMPRYRTEVTGIMRKPIPRGWLERETWYGNQAWRLVDDSGVVRKDWKPNSFHPQWIDVDGRGRVVFGEAGCLWAWTDFPDDEPKLIADLNGNRFEPVAAPDWAKEW